MSKLLQYLLSFLLFLTLFSTTYIINGIEWVVVMGVSMIVANQVNANKDD